MLNDIGIGLEWSYECTDRMTSRLRFCNNSRVWDQISISNYESKITETFVPHSWVVHWMYGLVRNRNSSLRTIRVRNLKKNFVIGFRTWVMSPDSGLLRNLCSKVGKCRKNAFSVTLIPCMALFDCNLQKSISSLKMIERLVCFIEWISMYWLMNILMVLMNGRDFNTYLYFLN